MHSLSAGLRNHARLAVLLCSSSGYHAAGGGAWLTNLSLVEGERTGMILTIFKAFPCCEGDERTTTSLHGSEHF
jgi:hypothetical protein